MKRYQKCQVVSVISRSPEAYASIALQLFGFLSVLY